MLHSVRPIHFEISRPRDSQYVASVRPSAERRSDLPNLRFLRPPRPAAYTYTYPPPAICSRYEFPGGDHLDRESLARSLAVCTTLLGTHVGRAVGSIDRDERYRRDIAAAVVVKEGGDRSGRAGQKNQHWNTYYSLRVA